MIHVSKPNEETRASSSPESVILSLKLIPPNERESTIVQKKGDPFAESFGDPLCKLNLKETSDFVRGFPMNNNNNTSAERRRSSVVGHNRRSIEAAPSTPGRPIFNFSVGNLSKKSIPSKWESAEKWLNSSSDESPAHVAKASYVSRFSRQNCGFHQKVETFEEMKTSSLPSDVFLKDKFTDNMEPIFRNFQCSEATKESFVFSEPLKNSTNEVQHRDIGTEMTPLASSTTTRCHTPLKSSSPLRHNTPDNRSGPLVMAFNNCVDISKLKDCHFDSKWSSREEEEEEVSKSLRHFEEISRGFSSLWEDEERTKSCMRYKREEARIQAWLNLQKAKAEAQSRKLEVKIEKMRSDLGEKMMKRMAIVNRRAEEWRATAQLHHSQQVLKASERQAQKMKSHRRSHVDDCKSCGCFPCNDHL